jgi:hypothetical protein
MTRPARVVNVEHLDQLRLRLTFSDGLVRELDFAGVLEGRMFDSLKDQEYFAQVFVDEVSGTIAWPNGIDLDPDVLHGNHEPASGREARLLKEYRLRPTG